MTGYEGDISNLFQHEHYDWCYYNKKTSRFTFNREVLGRVLVPEKRGNEMSQLITKTNGIFVPRRERKSLKVPELHSEIERKSQDTFE